MEDRNIYDEAYDEGYKDGKDDDGVQNFAQSLTKGYRMPFSDEKINESYNLGYEDGVSDYYDEKNSNYRGKNRDIKNYKGYKQREKEAAEHEQRIQKQKEKEEAEYQQQSSYQTSSNEGDNSCLVLIGFLIIVAAVLWFVFAVAIPLVLINIATISLIAGLAKRDWSKYLFPLSVLGGIGIVFDYNYGWATKALVTNVPFFQELIPVFFYLNIVTGLIAAYFLTRNLLNDKYGISEREFSKRNLIIMGCLLIIGTLTIGLQEYFDSQSSGGGSKKKEVAVHDGESTVTGFVQTKEEDSTLSLRSEPSTESSIVGSMPNGSALIILKDSFYVDIINGKEGKWVKVNYNGTEGWAWSDSIIEDTDNFTGIWKGGSMIFTITKESGRYKIKVTNEGIEGSPTDNLICTFKEGKIFYPGREADYNKYQIPTIELLPNGHLMYRDGADDVELTVVQGIEAVIKNTDNLSSTQTSVSVPIENLFKAWSELNLNLYMEQWSTNAAQYSKKFSPRKYQDILNRRRSFFSQLSSVEVIKYEILDLNSEENDRSTLIVKYSMDFHLKNGKKMSEANIIEKYVLEYDNNKKQWVILENFDYID